MTLELSTLLWGMYFLVGVLIQVLIQYGVLNRLRFAIPRTFDDFAAASSFTTVIFILLWPVWLAVGFFSKKRRKLIGEAKRGNDPDEPKGTA